MLKRTTIKTDDYDLIMSPLFVSELVKGPLIAGISYELIAQNRSFLTGLENTQITSSCISIKNKPDIECGNGSTNYDDEGVPTYEFDIIKDGMLNTYLYNTYWANRIGVESNGCARRNGVANVPSIGPQNIVFKAGDISAEEMISETKKGIYCEYTGDSPNMTNGYFSGVVMVGYEINNGEIGLGVEEGVLAIPLLDLYNKISQVGKQLTQIGSSYVPHLKLSKIKIAGQ
jgi:predicted Zn-dependent protease